MTKQFTTDTPTWDDIRKLRQPRHDTVWVPLDSDLMDRVEALEKQVKLEERKDEREHRRAVAPRLQTELDELLDVAEQAAVPFKIRELPRRIYRALIDAHPATEADKARGINRWSEDSFAPALLAAACVQPALTTIPRDDYLAMLQPGVDPEKLREHIAPAVEIWDDWSSATAYQLFAAAYELQEGGSRVPFTVRRSSETPASPPSSTTAPAEE